MFPSFKERCKNSKYFAKLPKTDKKKQKKTKKACLVPFPEVVRRC